MLAVLGCGDGAVGTAHVVASQQAVRLVAVDGPPDGVENRPLTPAPRFVAVDERGAVVRSRAGRVTLRLAPSPHPTALDGEVTVVASNREARFDRVRLTRVARGLSLVVDTPELPSTTTAPFGVGIPFRAISAGGGYTCGVAADGRGLCWGKNHFGRLGDGTQTDRPPPTPVAGDLRFATIHSVAISTCALTAEGGAYCWGPSVYAIALGTPGAVPTDQPHIVGPAPP